MLEYKYTLESDFLQSYMNRFILKKFFSENFSIVSDAYIFNSCVHLNPIAFNLADCSTRRDNIEKFISDNESAFNKYKEALLQCKPQLRQAHSISKELEKDTRGISASETNFLNFKLAGAESSLEQCMKSNLQ